MAIIFRTYQQEIINKSVDILYTSRILYLAMEVRTGKTLTSLGICDNLPVHTCQCECQLDLLPVNAALCF